MKKPFANVWGALILVLILTVSLCGAAAESYDASTMRLLRHEGNVEIFDANGVPRFVMDNVRFMSGESMQTGEDGMASVGLDDTKIVTLDASSRVEFAQESGHLLLKLTEGAIFLDVQKKLDENESLDIQTTTMTVGIRGTIIFMKESPDSASGRGITTLGVLEGTAQVDYKDESGAHRLLDVPKGRVATIQTSGADGTVASVTKMTLQDVEGFVREVVESTPSLLSRAEMPTGTGEGSEDELYPADGDWTWTGTVELVAQSASKLYDGKPLTRPSDVLVRGLPAGLNIHVTVSGSQTDAGFSENRITGYTITNSSGDNVNSHFSNITTVDGVLTVDPAPLAVWTGSAEKIYDGEPLTCPEAEMKTVPGYVSGEPVWRNTSLTTPTAAGSEIMYAVSGTTWVHASNPLTGKTVEQVLNAGQRMRVVLHSEKDQKSIEFVIEDMAVEDLPEEILRLYKDNPELMAQACLDTGWDPEALSARIEELQEVEKTSVIQNGLEIDEIYEDRLVRDSANVRITIDTQITNYDSRPLGSKEADFTPIQIPSSVKVYATGSQTEPGESENTYEIDWGTTNQNNYVFVEDLGTLKVLPRYDEPLTLTVPSATKVYDGKPLEDGKVRISGLPEGFTVNLSVKGSQTNVGKSKNSIEEYQILDAEGNDATAQFTNIKVVEGVLEVEPAPLTVTTGSAEKVYDGTPLTSEAATLSGLVNDETASISATGSITESGSADNTYAIEWGTAKESNYTVSSETLGTLTVESLSLELNCGGIETAYNGSLFIPNPTLTYMNGSHAGETQTGTRVSNNRMGLYAGTNPALSSPRSASLVFRFTLFSGDTVDLTITGMGTGAGTYTLTGSVSASSESFDLNFTGTELTISPLSLTITTPSASKPYDSTPLTASPAAIEGLADGETITVTTTGTITDVGTADNSCSIDWGDTDSANYTVTQVLGTLEITSFDEAVTITAASVTKAYDGTTLTDSSCTVTGLPEGFTCTTVIKGSQHSPGSSANTVESYTIYNADHADVTVAFTNVTVTDGTLTVTKNDTPITLTASSTTVAYDGSSRYTFGGVTVDGLPDDIFIMAEAPCTFKDAGTYPMNVSYYMLDNETGEDPESYFTNITVVNGTLTVTPAAATIVTGSDSKVYDGTALTKNEASITGLLGSDTATVTATGSQKDAGTSENTYAIDWGSTNSANYTITETLGTLEVTPLDVKVEIQDTEYTFNHAYNFVKVNIICDQDHTDGFLGDNAYYVVAADARFIVAFSDSAKQKDASVVDLTGTVSEWSYGNAANFNVTVTGGKLTVKPCPITLTTGSATKPYDGSPLSSSEWSITGFPSTEAVYVTPTGSITEIGSTENSYTIDWNGWVSTNYALTENLGTLEVTANANPVYLYAGSGSKTYDGTPLTANEITWEGLPDGFTVTGTCSGSQTNADSSENAISSYKILNADSVDVTAGYTNVITETGTLTVEQLQVNINLGGDSCSRVYGTSVTPPYATAVYGNGDHTGEAVSVFHRSTSTLGTTTIFRTYVGDTFNLSLSGWYNSNAGSHSLSYPIGFNSGSKDNYAFSFTNESFTVTPAPVTVSTGSATKAYDGSALTKSEASITGLVSSDTATVTATGKQTDVGTSDNTYSIDWGSTNSANYTVNETLGSLEVTANTNAVKIIAASDSKVYDGTALTANTVTAEGLPTGFTVTGTCTGSQTNVGSSENKVTAYTILNTASEDVTANFTNISTVDGTLTVTPATAVITTGSATKAYDGAALTNDEAAITGLVGGDTAAVTATGSQTVVGSSDNSYSIEWGSTNTANYSVTEELGTLEVTANTTPVTITAASDSKVYNGTALTANSVTAEGLPTGFTVTGTCTGSQTNAGSSANKVASYRILNAASADVTAYFTNISTVDGTLTVTTAAAVITTGSETKAYDGEALTKNEASITGLVGGETAAVTVTGSQTIVGSSDNTYSIVWGSTNSANYSITETLGTLTVTENSDPVYLYAESGSKTYDGTPLTTNEITWENLPAGFTVTGTCSGSQTNAGSSDNTISSYTILNTSEENVTACFTNINKESSTLTVEPATVTITTGSATKAYDGAPLTKNEANITGLVGGETATVTATGKQTDVGTSDNTYSIDWGSTNSANYTVNETLGSLEVTANTNAVKIIAASDSKVYDGTALTANTVTAEGLPDGFTVSGTCNGSQTNVGSSENKVTAYTILNTASEDVTANFTNISTVDGTLTVTPATAVITTGSATKAYDGAALTNDEAAITGLVGGDTAAVTATGSQTVVGSSDNSYSIEWGSTNTANYSVTEELGTLEVTANTTPVTITAASDSKVYNGTALTANSVTAEGLPTGFTVTGTCTGSQTNAGSSANKVASYRILNAASADVTAYFTNVSTVDGLLTVTTAAAVITTGSETKAYDGEALTKNEASITGLVGGETATVTATGSQTIVGSSDNTYSIVWGSTNSANYSITETLGTLTVTENSDPVYLYAESGSKTYDGTPLTTNEITWENLPTGFTVTGTCTGSQTNAGSSENTIASYTILNASEENVTAYFTSVSTESSTLTVDPATVTITTGSATKVYDGAPLTKNEANITGLVGGEAATVTATGKQTDVGTSDNTYSIDWGSTNSANYTVNETLGSLEVTANTNAVKIIAVSDSKVYDGTALTANTVTAEGLPDGFTVSGTCNGSQTNVGSSENKVTAYTILNTASEDVTANFTNISTVDGTLTVTPATAVITTGSATKAYDGAALTNDEAAITGLVGGDTAAVTATGSQTVVGSSDNSYSIEWGSTNTANYSVTEELGTLEVTANTTPVTITAASDSKVYNGTALTANSVTAEGLPTGFTVTGTCTGSQTNAGSSANKVASYRILNAASADVTAYFTNISTVDGTLTVTTAAAVITTGSETRAYDGEALTKNEASITGLVGGETATVTATGSQTIVGSSDNTYSIVWGSTNSANYSITETLGTLTVTENSDPVYLYAESGSKTYDGTPLTTNEITWENLPTGFTVTGTCTGSQTNAGSSENTIASYTILNASEENVTAYFTSISTESSTLTVDPATVTVTTGSATKAYDGTPVTKNEANITGLVGGEAATVTATGKQTDVGTSDNTYSIDWGSTNSANYTVNETLGSLEVTANTTAVTITAASDSKAYDGTALTANTMTTEGLPTGFTVTGTCSGSQTNAGSSENKVTAYTILNTASEDVTANFTNISTVDGTLTVTPATAVITTGSATKAYDGAALTNDEAAITGLVGGDTAAVTATGSQTVVGSSDNSYSIEWGSTNTANYSVTEELGTLEVTANTTPVTITAASDSKVYNGTALTANSVTAEGLPTGFTVTGTCTGSQTNAGSSANKVASYRILNAASADVTAYFTNVSTVDGMLTVRKAAAIIETGSETKTYDGSPVVCTDAPISGFIETDVSVTPNGSQTDAGSSENTYTIEWGSANPDNYAVTENLGTLKVTPAEATVSTPSVTEQYDGTPKTAGPATISGLTSTDESKVTVTATGSQTEVGSSKNTYTIDWGTANSNNYSLTEALGDITVISNDTHLVIASDPASGEYTPFGLKKDSYTVTGSLPDGFTLEVNVTGSLSLPGTTANTIESYTIRDQNGVDRTACFTNVELVEGTLTMTKAKITVQSEDQNVTYRANSFEPKVHWSGVFAADGPTALDLTITDQEYVKDVGTYHPTFTAAINREDLKDKYEIGTVTYGTVVIGQAPLNIVTPSASKVYDGTPLTANGIPLDDLCGMEYFSVTANATGTITNAGNTPNTYDINWNSVKSSNYAIAEELGTLTVDALQLRFNLGGTAMQYGNTTHVLAPTLTYLNGDHTGETVSPTSVSETDDGCEAVFSLVTSETVTLTVSGFTSEDAGTYTLSGNCLFSKSASNYSVTYTGSTLTINPAAISVTTRTESKVYDGDPLPETTVQPIVTGAPDGVEIYATHTASIENVSSVTNTYEMEWNGENPDNYTIEEHLGTLTIEPLQMRINVGGQTRQYDGTTGTISKPTVTYLNGEHAGETDTASMTTLTYDGIEVKISLCTNEYLTIAVSGYRTDVGTHMLNYSCTFQNSASNYALTYTNTQDVVTPAPVTITTESATKVYDRIPLTAGVSITGLQNGETVTVSATGSQTDVGYSTNGYSIDWGDTNSENYTVTENLGTLTVNPVQLTVTTPTESKVYDGDPLPETTNQPSVAGVPDWAVIYATATGYLDHVDSINNTYSMEWNGEKQSNYSITEHLGTLTISQLQLRFNLGGRTVSVGDSASVLSPSLSYGNGDHASQTVTPDSVTPAGDGYTARFTIFTGETVTLTVHGFNSEEERTCTLTGSCTFSGSASNFSVSYNDTTVTVSENMSIDGLVKRQLRMRVRGKGGGLVKSHR